MVPSMFLKRISRLVLPKSFGPVHTQRPPSHGCGPITSESPLFNFTSVVSSQPLLLWIFTYGMMESGLQAPPSAPSITIVVIVLAFAVIESALPETAMSDCLVKLPGSSNRTTFALVPIFTNSPRSKLYFTSLEPLLRTISTRAPSGRSAASVLPLSLSIMRDPGRM